ncbi:hypothetical protein [Hymenobacter metallicola]|uniref:Uncharacterized protein n=1 Tax=Hymenobacter metallicola TaxID=2563114 RepID=A0A4Z0QHL9_9BACT|nr:hypothetical protein [Hymenobacter metallicola]TGE29567.1 hypothetical protein E5K02_08960 [Hymenobacter metallicola]
MKAVGRGAAPEKPTTALLRAKATRQVLKNLSGVHAKEKRREDLLCSFKALSKSMPTGCCLLEELDNTGIGHGKDKICLKLAFAFPI